MASSSTSVPAVQLGPPVSEKLTKENYLLWRAQFLPAIRGVQLMGYLDGTTPEPAKTIEDDKKQIVANPAYELWVAKD